MNLIMGNQVGSLALQHGIVTAIIHLYVCLCILNGMLIDWEFQISKQQA